MALDSNLPFLDQDEAHGERTTGIGDGFAEPDSGTVTLTKGKTVSVVFEGDKALAEAFSKAINAAQRAREEKARLDTAAAAKKKEGLFYEKREGEERVLMKKEEARSRAAEVRPLLGGTQEARHPGWSSEVFE